MVEEYSQIIEHAPHAVTVYWKLSRSTLPNVGEEGRSIMLVEEGHKRTLIEEGHRRTPLEERL